MLVEYIYAAGIAYAGQLTIEFTLGEFLFPSIDVSLEQSNVFEQILVVQEHILQNCSVQTGILVRQRIANLLTGSLSIIALQRRVLGENAMGTHRRFGHHFGEAKRCLSQNFNIPILVR